MTIELRQYQLDSIRALWKYWHKNPMGNPLICAPTGSGKSVILAAICQKILEKRSDFKALILSHRKEIIAQNARAIGRLLNIPIGVYSAGLKIKTIRSITCANIQSIYKKELDLDLIIVDECHLFSSDEKSMYQKFVERARTKNRSVRIMGLTATPYRMDQGNLVGNDKFFHEICYNISVPRLIEEKFLAPVISCPSQKEIDFSNVKKIGFDYSESALEEIMTPLVQEHVIEIAQRAHARKHWLIFCSSVRHTKDICATLNAAGFCAEYISGEMLSMERDQKIERFKRGEIRALCNCEILTTGFDFPELDCLAIIRATRSTALYVQMVGRGMRIAEGKESCLLLDFGGNIRRHGPIDCIVVEDGSDKVAIKKEPTRECPVCGVVCAASRIDCPECGFIFPIVPRVFSKDIEPEPTEESAIGSKPKIYRVSSVEYKVHNKEGSPPSLRMNLYIGTLRVSEFLCFNHGGFPAKMAAKKWTQYGGTIQPVSTDDAFAKSAELPTPDEVEVIREGKFHRVLRVISFRKPVDSMAEIGINI